MSNPTGYSWLIAPSATIINPLSGIVSDNNASFEFISDDPTSTFEVKLDVGSWSASTSPKSYSTLADGAHNFYVRAVSPTDIITGSATTSSWTVAATPPNTGAATVGVPLYRVTTSGIRFGNAKGGKASNVVHGGPRVWYVNSVQNILQENSSMGAIDVVTISGSLMNSVSSSLKESDVITRKNEDIYNRIIKSASYVPLWTQENLSAGTAFVCTLLSSSNHEVSSLNTFRSGTIKLENSVIPASGTLYYNKKRGLQKRTYAVTSSITSIQTGLLIACTGGISRETYNDPAITSYSEATGRGITFAHAVGATRLSGSGFDLYPIVTGPGAGRKCIYHSVSGTYMNSTVYDPSIIRFNVPEKGKIVDIKVWIEFVHDVRQGTGSLGARSGSLKQGLQGVAIALKSPNVHFKYAHPYHQKFASNFITHDRQHESKYKEFHNYSQTIGSSFNELQFGSAGGDTLIPKYSTVPKLLQSSYLLWEGHATFIDDLMMSFSANETAPTGSITWQNDAMVGTGSFTQRYMSPRFDLMYGEWDTDLDMRTIFTDSSKIRNPRNYCDMYDTIQLDNITKKAGIYGAIDSAVHDTYAPNRVIFDQGSTDIQGKFTASSIHGNNIPWFYDQRIPFGNYTTPIPNLQLSRSLSPPIGWLTGPANTAAVAEFNTTGTQIGPSDIQPVYPLLEDIYIRKLTKPKSTLDKFKSTEADTIHSSFPNDDETYYGCIFGGGRKYVGTEIYEDGISNYEAFRPGLRGTEMNGIWELMIGLAGYRQDDPTLNDKQGYWCKDRTGIWFRQARLEITYEENSDCEINNSTRIKRYKKKNNPVSSKMKIHGIISGSTIYDCGLSVIYSKYEDNDYGRTVGITDNTASLNSNNFAIFTRLTGTIAEKLYNSGSQYYLINEFGTPYIPLSSGSSNDYYDDIKIYSQEEKQRSRDTLTAIISDNKNINSDLQSFLSRQRRSIRSYEKISIISNSGSNTN